MINFRKITLQNFFSVGNTPLTFDLNGPSPVLVSGTNGTGKSVCVVDSICWVLFNKPYRKVNKGDIVNNVNGKKCRVEIEFDIGQDSYVVTRGIKPNVFEITKNGDLIDQESAADYQSMLEDNILRLTFESFKQVVILSSTSFVPFMELSTPQRRVIVEDILDVGIFVKMAKHLKDRQSDIKTDMTLVEGRIVTSEQTIEALEGLLKVLTESVEDDISEKEAELAKLKADMHPAHGQYEEDYARYLDGKKAYDDQLAKLKAKQQHHLDTIRTSANILQQNKHKLENIDNDTHCDKCGQELPKDDNTATIKFIEKQNAELNTTIEEADLVIKGVAKQIVDLDDAILPGMEAFESELNQKKSALMAASQIIKRLEEEIAKAKEKAANNEKAAETEASIKRAKAQREDDVAKRQELQRKNDVMSITHEILGKDSGIKKTVLERYIPVIVERVNHYLDVLNFFVKFDMDTSFTETIKVRHRELQKYASLSQGEKQRIDLALLFAWRDVAKMKNSVHTNLLILDETFDTSLDETGIDNLMMILEELVQQTNVFVISHKGEVLSERIPNRILFTKKNGFTQIGEA